MSHMSRLQSPHDRILRFLGAGIRSSAAGELDLVEELRRGLPAGAFKHAAAQLAVPASDLSRWLGLNRRTLARRTRRLSATESSRLFRLARIHSRAAEVLEGPQAATHWLLRPQRALGGHAPVSLLDTDAGALAVERLLGRIEDAVVT